MERRPDCKNRITKTRRLLQKTTEELENNKEVDRNGKKSHKEIIQ